MYVREKIKNHFLNLLDNETYAMSYFYKKDIPEEFNNDKLVMLENNMKKSESRYDTCLNIYSLVKKLGIESLIDKVTSNLAKAQNMYSKNMSELDVFKSNLAYLIISGILKLENAQVMGYSKDFIEEFLVPYQSQANNPYNQYYYNENNGITSMIDENGFSVCLPYTPFAIKKRMHKR